jgi:hypothetical protein
MSAETDYLRGEQDNLLETVRLIEIGRSVTDICRDFLSRLR